MASCSSRGRARASSALGSHQPAVVAFISVVLQGGKGRSQQLYLLLPCFLSPSESLIKSGHIGRFPLLRRELQLGLKPQLWGVWGRGGSSIYYLVPSSWSGEAVLLSWAAFKIRWLESKSWLHPRGGSSWLPCPQQSFARGPFPRCLWEMLACLSPA